MLYHYASESIQAFRKIKQPFEHILYGRKIPRSQRKLTDIFYNTLRAHVLRSLFEYDDYNVLLASSCLALVLNSDFSISHCPTRPYCFMIDWQQFLAILYVTLCPDIYTVISNIPLKSALPSLPSFIA